MPYHSTPSPSYHNAHLQVKRARGSASEHLCVDCGGPATDWSLSLTIAIDRSLPILWEFWTHAKRAGARRGGRMYCMSIDAYEPRCVPCHSAQERSQVDLRNRLHQEEHDRRKTHGAEPTRTSRAIQPPDDYPIPPRLDLSTDCPDMSSSVPSSKSHNTEQPCFA
jgi:hypothetical protein